jgi:hypothetical protein
MYTVGGSPSTDLLSTYGGVLVAGLIHCGLPTALMHLGVHELSCLATPAAVLLAQVHRLFACFNFSLGEGVTITHFFALNLSGHSVLCGSSPAATPCCIYFSIRSASHCNSITFVWPPGLLESQTAPFS